ncbi:hypothetical protein ACO0R3_003588 [Hanseniaspora guilliermondii]
MNSQKLTTHPTDSSNNNETDTTNHNGQPLSNNTYMPQTSQNAAVNALNTAAAIQESSAAKLINKSSIHNELGDVKKKSSDESALSQHNVAADQTLSRVNTSKSEPDYKSKPKEFINTGALNTANNIAAASVEKFKTDIKAVSEGNRSSIDVTNGSVYSQNLQDPTIQETNPQETEHNQQRQINESTENNNITQFTPLQISTKEMSQRFNKDSSKSEIPQVSNTLESNAPSQMATSGEQENEAYQETGFNADENDNAQRPLNVRDALSYLEEVKLQFFNRPAVYNSFLDIMKDFKAQTIDTPGVIERVSTLFSDYPLLIQGFNTFLPHGYKIEYSDVPGDPFPVKVITPYSGGAVELNAGVLHAQQQEAQISQINERNQENTAQEYIDGSRVNNNHPRDVSEYSEGKSVKVEAENAPTYQDNISQNHVIEADVNQDQQSDVEFSHAINYVNKIKTRFKSDPSVYKSFLEILQTYQTDQRPIHEVYEQVTMLFQGAPDLLDDFKKFLPDTTQEQPQGLQGPPQITTNHEIEHPVSETQKVQQMPPIGSFSPPKQAQVTDSILLNEQAQHNLILENDGHLVEAAGNADIPISNLRGQPYNPEDVNELNQQNFNPDYSSHSIGLENNMLGTGQSNVERPEIDLDPSLVPIIPEPLEPAESELEINDEVHFFEKVKKKIGSKQVYQDFLKLLNIYTQDLISKNDLIRKIAQFIGNDDELFSWFKMFIGYEELPKEIENIVYEKHRVDLDLCEACGPSYKRLPKADTFMPCSGRDEMCWEVLNDEWVGHPVWASEESGFIAHRKNQYEETLFKTEEERHEYDFYIEANLRTIQTLEVINNRINAMTPEEKASFRLPEGLGATSMTIYKKVIRKVYEKDRGLEIIEALHEHPAQTVSVVLNRLKQKDEEWRRNQREWNKVWRDIEQKVYYKSLDHLGLTFKQTDKKLLLTKQLLSDLSTIKEDPLCKEFGTSSVANKRWNPLISKPRSELVYEYKDTEILFDIVNMCKGFISKVSSYSQSDKEKLEIFLYWFVCHFFDIPYSELIENTFKDKVADDDSKVGDKRSADASLEQISLLEKLEGLNGIFSIIHKNDGGEATDHHSDDSDKSSTTETDENELFKKSILKSWSVNVVSGPVDEEAFDKKERDRFIFYGNTQIYLLVRVFSILYERLLEVKEIDKEVTADIKKRSSNGFIDQMFLSSQQISDRGFGFDGNSAYSELTRHINDFIEGKIDGSWFEESLRQAYKNKAFKLATVDKVVQQIVKQCNNCTTDKKSQSLLKLFECDRKDSALLLKNQILLRIQSRRVLDNNEMMFSIDYSKKSGRLVIQYVKTDNVPVSTENNTQSEERWKSYVQSYQMSYSTEGANAAAATDLVHEKVDADEAKEDEVIEKTKLSLEIDKTDYKSNIKQGSTNVFSQKEIEDPSLKTSAPPEPLLKEWITANSAQKSSAEETH